MLIQLSTCTEKPPSTWATAPHYGEAESSAHQHPQRQWPVTDQHVRRRLPIQVQINTSDGQLLAHRPPTNPVRHLRPGLESDGHLSASETSTGMRERVSEVGARKGQDSSGECACVCACARKENVCVCVCMGRMCVCVRDMGNTMGRTLAGSMRVCMRVHAGRVCVCACAWGECVCVRVCV